MEFITKFWWKPSKTHTWQIALCDVKLSAPQSQSQRPPVGSRGVHLTQERHSSLPCCYPALGRRYQLATRQRNQQTQEQTRKGQNFCSHRMSISPEKPRETIIQPHSQVARHKKANHLMGKTENSPYSSAWTYRKTTVTPPGRHRLCSFGAILSSFTIGCNPNTRSNKHLCTYAKSKVRPHYTWKSHIHWRHTASQITGADWLLNKGGYKKWVAI